MPQQLALGITDLSNAAFCHRYANNERHIYNMGGIQCLGGGAVSLHFFQQMQCKAQNGGF